MTALGAGAQLLAMAITDEDITTRWDTTLTHDATLVMEADADEADGDADGADGDSDGTDGDTDGTDGDTDGDSSDSTDGD